jgi:hypothetical protein
VGVVVTRGEPGIVLHKLPNPWGDGDVPEESVIDVDALGWSTDASINGLATNEDTLAVSGESVVVLSLAAGGDVQDIGCPLGECWGVVLGPALLATTNGSELALARMDDGDWVWEDTLPVDLSPAAIDGDDVLLVQAGGYVYDDATGNNLPIYPGIVRLSAERELLAGATTCGVPHRLARVGGGWLIPETYTDTGYCWDYLEWLNPDGQLQQLAEVGPEPDRGAEDRFEEGAYAAAELGGNVYVATCKLGLMRGPWSTTGVDLVPVGPARAGCFRNVVAAGEVLAVETPDSLEFLRPCE